MTRRAPWIPPTVVAVFLMMAHSAAAHDLAEQRRLILSFRLTRSRCWWLGSRRADAGRLRSSFDWDRNGLIAGVLSDSPRPRACFRDWPQV
jgi:hypothetical protein